MGLSVGGTDDDIPNLWKVKEHVPNHRPESYKDTYSTMVSNPTLDNSSLMGNTAVFAELPLLKTIIPMTSQ
jgi:hypothetical protein